MRKGGGGQWVMCGLTAEVCSEWVVSRFVVSGGSQQRFVVSGGCQHRFVVSGG